MAQEPFDPHQTLALNTTLEREFVSPLTSIRGALEILRDFPDLSGDERLRFVTNALSDCTRLEQGIENLGATVYAGIAEPSPEAAVEPPAVSDNVYHRRIRFLEDQRIIEIDFSDFEFSSSAVVNEFYDLLDELIENTGHRWFILVNYRHCRIWPEAWIAFAHRGQKVNVSYSLGTVRYVETTDSEEDSNMFADPDLFSSRDAALARIEAMRNPS